MSSVWGLDPLQRYSRPPVDCQCSARFSPVRGEATCAPWSGPTPTHPRGDPCQRPSETRHSAGRACHCSLQPGIMFSASVIWFGMTSTLSQAPAWTVESRGFGVAGAGTYRKDGPLGASGRDGCPQVAPSLAQRRGILPGGVRPFVGVHRAHFHRGQLAVSVVASDGVYLHTTCRCALNGQQQDAQSKAKVDERPEWRTLGLTVMPASRTRMHACICVPVHGDVCVYACLFDALACEASRDVWTADCMHCCAFTHIWTNRSVRLSVQLSTHAHL